jgi:hypothetical protein
MRNCYVGAEQGIEIKMNLDLALRRLEKEG